MRPRRCAATIIGAIVLLAALALAAPAAASGPTVRGALAQARDAGAIDAGTYAAWRATYEQARAARDGLGGRCRTQLAAVLRQLERFARNDQLTPSRMPILFTQLARNTQFWSATGAIAAEGRVMFAGSDLVFEHFPGQGLQFHPLGTFGRMNAMANACLGYFGPKVACPRDELRRALDEVASVAVLRGRSLAWEYYWPYGGGQPPWVSSMAQATGLQAFAKGAEVLGEQRYLQVAIAGLPLFEMGPPLGVRVPARGGVAYLHYSFAPRTWILNAWLQTLIGLRDVATRSNDPRAWADFDKGDVAVRKLLRRFETGRGSRYELGGPPAPYNYQKLVVDFLGVLCNATKNSAYCRYAALFGSALRKVPKPPGGGGGSPPRCGVA